MRNILLVALLFSLPVIASAEPTRWRRLENGRVLFWTLHSEGEKVYVDQFSREPGRLQARDFSRSYADLVAAQRTFDDLTRGAIEGSPPAAPAQDFSASAEGIWAAPNQWSWEWERKFDTWMQESVDEHFLAKNGIATDCADAAFGLRWIFARMNGLPAAASLAGSSQTFSHESSDPAWSRLPTHTLWNQDQRFLAALNYLFENTYTHTLMVDTYPVAITREYLRAGSIFLHLYENGSGHTEVIHRVASDRASPDVLRVIASDVPREVRVLNEYGMQDWGDMPELGRSGLLRFRWPQANGRAWSLVPSEKMPGYSTEQYRPNFAYGRRNFVEAVNYRLFPDWAPNYRLTMRAKVEQALDRLRRRVDIVTEGYEFCAANDCAEGSAGWENWSTPSRDRAIGRVIEGIDALAKEYQCTSSCRAELNGRLADRITVVEGRVITFRMALDAWRRGKYSSDPRDPLANRWGLR